MIRYPHYWWSVKGKRFPSRIAVLDCSSRPCDAHGQPGTQRQQMASWRLISVSLHDGQPYNTITVDGDSAASAWDAIARLLSSKDRTWLFITPASRILELLDFWERLEESTVELCGRDWRSKDEASKGGEDHRDGVCVIEDPPTVILCRIWNRPGKLLVLDIRNWGIDPLPESMNHEQRATEYANGIRSIVSSLRQSGQGGLRATAASQAVQSLRQDEQCVRLHCHTHNNAIALERAAYYGGRCEAFQIGGLKPPIYHVDVRNMYPSIGLQCPVPISLRRYHADGRSAEIAVHTSPLTAIAHVRVRCAAACFPKRLRWGIVYPIGAYDTCLCGPELRIAVDNGAIVRVYSAAEYTCAGVLSGFYQQWLAMSAAARARGSALESAWIKRVMNALVGKFGEPGRRWIPAPARPDRPHFCTWYEFDQQGEPVRYRNVASYCQREETASESYWSIPSIAAWITSVGRVRLWDYMSICGQENVWYVDTDSLLTNRDGMDRLLRHGAIREGEVGYLRTLGRHNSGFVHGIRHYELDGAITCAGVLRGNILPGESRGEYFTRIKIGAAVSMGLRPPGERMPVGLPNPEPYRYGTVDANGRVSPLEIHDD